MVSVNASLDVPSHPSAHLIPRRVSQEGQSTEAQASASSASAASASAVPASAADPTAAGNGAPDFRALFTGVTTPVTAQPAQQNSAPTAESVFGATPWLTNPTGIGPTGAYSYNPIYFATPQTAAKVAQMVGGSVVGSNQFTAGGAFSQQQPNQMVELPDGRLINPGLVAAFYTHGYPQSYIDQLIAGEVSNT
jgi:hypothetical protein